MLGDEIGHKPAVRTERLYQRIAPAAQLGVALAEQQSNQTLKGLGERRIGDIALVLIKLPRSEKATWRYQYLVQFIHYRRFADPGIT